MTKLMDFLSLLAYQKSNSDVEIILHDFYQRLVHRK